MNEWLNATSQLFSFSLQFHLSPAPHICNLQLTSLSSFMAGLWSILTSFSLGRESTRLATAPMSLMALTDTSNSCRSWERKKGREKTSRIQIQFPDSVGSLTCILVIALTALEVTWFPCKENFRILANSAGEESAMIGKYLRLWKEASISVSCGMYWIPCRRWTRKRQTENSWRKKWDWVEMEGSIVAIVPIYRQPTGRWWSWVSGRSQMRFPVVVTPRRLETREYSRSP